MRRSVLPAMALALGVAVSGCGGGSDRDAAVPTPTPLAGSTAGQEPPATDTPAEPVNERGNVVRQLGEAVVVHPADDPAAQPDLAFTVLEITVDPECDRTDDPPVNGHFVAIRMEVAASPDHDPRVLTSFTEEDFSILGPDGAVVEVEDSNGDLCMEPEVTVSNMRFPPGIEYSGWIVLDVPVTAGALVYAAGGPQPDSEWQF
ncbi:hypothetical protein [Candidatus Blastococcus massiliensis]|uniref:hypothetical protein n=1 Tax=Candidatus Blastococcus massiliensis TaxID=1470358 RepID=UPI0012DCE5C4|nr:hypothetical protein [Candidatus Blastococcus massiliensis]